VSKNMAIIYNMIREGKPKISVAYLLTRETRPSCSSVLYILSLGYEVSKMDTNGRKLIPG
jgi:hypothetical protein